MLDAALALFMEQGYDDTTIQQVATAAGVAVQTVYFTFGNKPRLLSEVQDRVVYTTLSHEFELASEMGLSDDELAKCNQTAYEVKFG